jgi:Tannase and feruloyl esterase
MLNLQNTNLDGSSLDVLYPSAGERHYCLMQLLAWVEDGKAPETLSATRRDQTGNVTRSRPLCQYPLVAKYKGTGSTDDAANFVCGTGF